MGSTILLTGAAGFIGSHLADSLLHRNDTVIGIDNLNDYYDPERKRENLNEIVAKSPKNNFVFEQGDIRNLETLDKIFGEYRVDAVVHLAAMGGVRASIESPHLYYDINLIGTLNLLEAAQTHNVNNFVFASTSSAYGRTDKIPFVETDSCDRPLAPYPASKRSAEMLGFSFHHLYGLNFTALRFFTVYGPRNRPDMMPFLVLNNIFFDQQVPLYNGGHMKRDWTYVGDVVKGIVAAIDRPMGYEIINLGRGEPVLLLDFIDLVEKSAGKKANLQQAKMMDADMNTTYADISKARKLLNYVPSVTLEKGIQEFWSWYKRVILK